LEEINLSDKRIGQAGGITFSGCSSVLSLAVLCLGVQSLKLSISRGRWRGGSTERRPAGKRGRGTNAAAGKPGSRDRTGRAAGCSYFPEKQVSSVRLPYFGNGLEAVARWAKL
jgi:hypothetical protein